MNIHDKLEKFRQEKAQDFFTKELPERLKGFRAALEGTPEEIERKLEDQKEIYTLNFWDELDELEEQKKKSFELAGDNADILCENEEKPLASEIIEDLMKDRDLWEAKARTMIGFNDIYSLHEQIIKIVLQTTDAETLEIMYRHVSDVKKHQKEDE
nr:MAG: hypothetical protein [Bacteriophage sp.]